MVAIDHSCIYLKPTQHIIMLSQLVFVKTKTTPGQFTMVDYNMEGLLD
jgi:hypothetical protein